MRRRPLPELGSGLRTSAAVGEVDGGTYHGAQNEEMVTTASPETKLQVNITDVSLRSS
jgi:hypothetical protein